MSEYGLYSPKSRAVAAILAFFLGALGIHRFYVGKSGTGTVMLLFTLTVFGAFVSGVWALIDFVMILAGSFQDKQGRAIKNWSDV